ncbi:lysine---tRNA ligase [Powellomyces hirtus]|uniref:Lysine--tRNA ligase n=1 Tax=Powellomyces hirtus TaxID=109895 RepID=A0A507DWC6_9FUNG|nr:lysine---tRNA ligase [Powellomyces hirtus]
MEDRKGNGIIVVLERKDAAHNKRMQSCLTAPTGEEYRNHRLEQLRKLGLSNYPRFSPSSQVVTQTEFDSKYGAKYDAGQWGKDTGDRATLVGRVTARRDSKKLMFVDLSRDREHVQLVLRKADMGEGWDKIHQGLKVGDIVSASGSPGRTPAGQLSLAAQEVEILSPCLWTMPKELNDTRTRYQSRHLDLLTNVKSLRTFRQRAKIISSIRSYLDSNGFLEVETPILSTKQGGATAKPFTTTSNALSEHNQHLFMRVAPELYLKQLVIGGMDRVYELGKQFRNEGIDSTHNPEFTTCEFYMAYADLGTVMNMTEEIIRCAVKASGEHEELRVPHIIADKDGTLSDVEIDFGSKFARIDVVEELEKHIGKLPDLESPTALSDLVEILKKSNIPFPSPMTTPRLLDKLISHLIEPTISHNPTFLLNHPLALSPLAKRMSPDSPQTSRFELFVANRELVNAYEELNDPIEQRTRFLAQAEQRSTMGDEEAMVLDEGFCEALEWGLPPTTGWGLGVDRLVMLLTGATRIREVITFPIMNNVEQGDSE